MELLFRPRMQAERLLSLQDALTGNVSETSSAVLHAVCNVIVSSEAKAGPIVLSYLKALVASFKHLQFNSSWMLYAKEMAIIEAASQGLYAPGIPEDEFYKHGTYKGIIALILFFRRSESFNHQWARIGAELRPWLVQEAIGMLPKPILEWIEDWREGFLALRAEGTRPDPLPLQYLGNHSGRKQKQLTSETEARPPKKSKSNKPHTTKIHSTTLSAIPDESQQPLSSSPGPTRIPISELMSPTPWEAQITVLGSNCKPSLHQLPPTPKSRSSSICRNELSQAGSQLELRQNAYQMDSGDASLLEGDAPHTFNASSPRYQTQQYPQQRQKQPPPPNMSSLQNQATEDHGSNASFPNNTLPPLEQIQQLDIRLNNQEAADNRSSDYTSKGILNAPDYASPLDCDGYSGTTLSPTGGTKQHSAHTQQSTLALYSGASADPFHTALQDLAKQSPWIYEFLQILCALDPTAIHEHIFLHAVEPQQRWSSSGEIESIPLAKMVPGTKALKDLDTLDRALGTLLSSGFITSKPGPMCGRTFAIDSQVRLHIERSPDGLEMSKSQAMKIISVVFPRVEETQSLYGDLCRSQLPQLQYVLKYYFELKEKGLFSPHDGHELAGALISSSRIFSRDRNWKYHALSTAKQLLGRQPCKDRFADEDLYLWRWAEQRERFLKLESAVVPVTVTNPRSNVQHGQIILADAYKLIVAHDLPGASKLMDMIIPFDQVHHTYSTVESFLQIRVGLWRSKIDRYEGNFAGCEERIAQLLKVDRPYGSSGTRLLSTLAEVLCEMGRPTDAENVLREPLQHFEQYGWTKVRRGRLLQCSMADVLLSKKLYGEAYDLYQRLRDDSDSGLHCPGTEVDYFHYLVGLAMASHLANCLEKAHIHWSDVSSIIYRWGWKGGFSEMVTSYAISDINFKQRQAEAAEEFLKKGNNLFQKTGREYWITFLGTSFLDFLSDSLSQQTCSEIGIR